MTALLLSLAAALIVIGLGALLMVAGQRAGDRGEEAVLTAVESDEYGDGVWVTVHNPGRQPVLVGASVRRPGLRLRWEAGHFVRVPRRTLSDRLLAGQHALVCAVAAGDSETLLVPRTPHLKRRAELVVAIGQTDRLRVMHRAVELHELSRVTPPPAPAPARHIA